MSLECILVFKTPLSAMKWNYGLLLNLMVCVMSLVGTNDLQYDIGCIPRPPYGVLLVMGARSPRNPAITRVKKIWELGPEIPVMILSCDDIELWESDPEISVLVMSI